MIVGSIARPGDRAGPAHTDDEVSPMSVAPEGLPAGPCSSESLRREVDRQVVGLLRRNQEDNRQIIALLGEVVELLRESRAAGSTCTETGFFAAID